MVLMTGPRQVCETYLARSKMRKPIFTIRGLVSGDEGSRFENMVAVSLKKHCDAIEDYRGKRASLQFLRTKEKKEVDFMLVVEQEPVVMIEATLSDERVHGSLAYFQEKYGFHAIQLITNLKREQIRKGIEFRHAHTYLASL